MGHYTDDIATGLGRRKLRIAGRPPQGKAEKYVLLEEPGEPVLMHWQQRLVPHFKQNCPNCRGDEPKPMWYVGGYCEAHKEYVLVELPAKCYDSATASAQNGSGACFSGMVIVISREDFERSPRILRYDQHVKKYPVWPYETRRELAHTMDIKVKPKLYRAEDAS